MEIPVLTPAEEVVDGSPWTEAPPPRIEDQEVDLVALELWHQGSCPELVHEEELPEPEEAIGCHSSCL